MPPPSLSGLRIFDAAARLGSFKAAAADLALSPTAVSHQIRALEARVGVPLFERSVRKVVLSPAGRMLAEATGPAFQLIDAALENLNEGERSLTVSATPAFAALWLVPRIGLFEAANPGLRVHVDTSTAPVDLARDRRIDLAIRYGRREDPGLITKRLCRERVAAYAAPDYLDRLPSFAEAQLIETQWLSSSLPAITWTDWCVRAREAPPARGRRRLFRQEQHVIQAGLAGQGLILVSSLLVADMVARGWLRPYRPEIALEGLSYFSATSDARMTARKVRRFLAWLGEQSFEDSPAVEPDADLARSL